METASTPPRGPRRPSASVLLDSGIFVLGLGVLVGALHAWWAAGADPRLAAALAVTLPLGWVLTRFPLMVTGGASGIHVPFAPVVLFYLLVVLPPPVALAAWALTAVPAYFVDRRPWQSRVFNAGSSMVSSLLAVLVVGALAPARPVDTRMLLAVLAGAATYFATDTVLSAVSIAVERRRAVLAELAEPGALVGGGLFLLVAALGYLAGAVRHDMPGWVAALTLLPSMAVVVAAWAWRRAHESRRQQRAPSSRRPCASTPSRASRSCCGPSRRTGRPSSPGAGSRCGPGRRSSTRSAASSATTPAAGSSRPGRPAGTPSSSTRWPWPPSGPSPRPRCCACGWPPRPNGSPSSTPSPGWPTAARSRRAWRRPSRTARGAVAVLFVDLDGFKAVNDTLGHAAGDELLTESARRLLDAAGPDGFVARLGGDEFAVVLPDLFPGAVDDTAEAVVTALRAPFLLSAGPATISASVGVTASEQGDDADTLLSRADAAMYVAKRAGGGRSVLGV